MKALILITALTLSLPALAEVTCRTPAYTRTFDIKDTAGSMTLRCRPGEFLTEVEPTIIKGGQAGIQDRDLISQGVIKYEFWLSSESVVDGKDEDGEDAWVDAEPSAVTIQLKGICCK